MRTNRCTCAGHTGDEVWHGTKGGRYYHHCMCEVCIMGARALDRKRWERRYARKYGLTVEQIRELLTVGRCAICQTMNPNGPWHIDHDHTYCAGSKCCGRCIRGVLCAGCNYLLGAARDNTDTLRAAITYLERYSTGLRTAA